MVNKTAQRVANRMVNVSYERSNFKNKVSKIIFLILSIIAGIFGLFFLFFNWKMGLIILGIALLFYGMSRLTKLGNKMNKKFQKEYNEKYAVKEEDEGNI